MMNRVQKNTNDITAKQRTDAEIALSVLQCLDSAPNATEPQYNFKGDKYNPQGLTLENYEKTYKQPGIVFSYNSRGQIDFVQFGHDGYLATVTKDSAKVEKGGTFSSWPQ